MMTRLYTVWTLASTFLYIADISLPDAAHEKTVPFSMTVLLVLITYADFICTVNVFTEMDAGRIFKTTITR
jgi:hypothetical protein